MPLLSSGERSVLIETIRALGRIGDPSAADALLRFIHQAGTDPQVRLEAVAAPLAALRAQGVPADHRHAARPAVGSEAGDPRGGAPLDRDARLRELHHGPVGARSRSALERPGRSRLPPRHARARSRASATERDARRLGSARHPCGARRARQAESAERDAASCSIDLKADDPVVRAAAATGLGELKPPNGAPALAEAYTAAQRDANYTARAAALAAIAKYGPAAATPVLKSAFADKDWAVRVRAVMLLKALDPAAAADADAQIRPAPDDAAAGDVSGRARDRSARLDAGVYRDGSGHDPDRAGGARRAAHGREFHRAGAQGLLQRPQHPPRRAELRRAGRRSRAATAKARRATRSATSSTSGRIYAGRSGWRSTPGPTPAAASGSSPTRRSRISTRSTRSSAASSAGMEVVDQIQQWDVIRHARVGWPADDATVVGSR